MGKLTWWQSSLILLESHFEEGMHIDQPLPLFVRLHQLFDRRYCIPLAIAYAIRTPDASAETARSFRNILRWPGVSNSAATTINVT